MSNRQISQTAKDLIEAKKLIEDRDNWWGSNRRARPQLFCAVQALHHVIMKMDTIKSYESRNYYEDIYDKRKKLLTNASHTLYGMGIVAVNDSIGHEAVMKVYDLAIQNSFTP